MRVLFARALELQSSLRFLVFGFGAFLSLLSECRSWGVEVQFALAHNTPKPVSPNMPRNRYPALLSLFLKQPLHDATTLSVTHVTQAEARPFLTSALPRTPFAVLCALSFS